MIRAPGRVHWSIGYDAGWTPLGHSDPQEYKSYQNDQKYPPGPIGHESRWYRLVISDPEKSALSMSRRVPRPGGAIGTAGSRCSARCAERWTRRAGGLGLMAVAPY